MGTEQWHPDINITDAFARNIIERQFHELSPINITLIGEGWDNKVFLVNNQFVFRFPHRKIAAKLIERENAVLGYLQDIVNLEIPNPVYVGKPKENYPYHFHGYQMIKGKSGCHAHLSMDSRSESVLKIAEFLKQLHYINETEARAIGAEDQFFDRTNSSSIIYELKKRVEKINRRNIASINLTTFNEEITIAAAVNLPKKRVLVHGDLYCRHLMFDNNKLTGIIDWGDIGINSPAVDLSVVFSFYSSGCYKEFFDIYGDIDSQTFAYARFLGLYSALTVLLYGHDVDDIHLVSEATDAIIRINPNLLKS